MPTAKDMTLRDVLYNSASFFGEKTAVEEKHGDNYVSYSYNRLAADASRLGVALIKKGLSGKNIMIIGENGYAWAVSYFAASCFSGTAVPISHSFSAQSVLEAAEACDVAGVIYSDSSAELIALLPENVIRIPFSVLGVLIRSCKNGELSSLAPNAVAELSYTSGTEEKSKTVVLTHKNICFSLSQIERMIPISKDDKLYSILPLAHIYERVCGLLYPIYRGAGVAYGEGLLHLSTNMRIVRPTALLCVPMVLERIYGKIWANIEKKGIGEKVRRAIRLTAAAGPLRTAVRREVFAEIHDSLGGKLSFIITGGAPANPESIYGLREFGIRTYQGYGLTETAAVVSVNTKELHEYASAGLPVPDGLADIYNMDADGVGEIRYKGDNVMEGYYKDPELTAATLKDGWLYTGDMGYFDRRGFLHIVGRKNNMIVTARRRAVFPEELETLLCRNPFIKEALVKGEANEGRGDYDVVAHIFPRVKNIRELYGEKYTSEQLSGEVRKAVEAVNLQVDPHKQIKKFVLHDSEFEKNEAGKIIRSASVSD